MPRIISPLEKFLQAFILANKEGRIVCTKGFLNGVQMNPYTFRSSFNMWSGIPLFEQRDIPNGYRYNIKISEEMEEEAIHLPWDPIASIELKRTGLELPEVSVGKMLCCQDKKSEELGYFLWSKDELVRNLDRAGINYRIVARVPYKKM